jgi:hypothetical protein
VFYLAVGLGDTASQLQVDVRVPDRAPLPPQGAVGGDGGRYEARLHSRMMYPVVQGRRRTGLHNMGVNMRQVRKMKRRT